MAKQIVILDRSLTPDGAAWRVAFWAAVPAAKQTFWAGKQAASVWPGASNAENTAISTGTIREMVETFTPPAAWTIPQMQAALIVHFTAWQNQVNADLTFGRQGTFYDGSIWTAGGA